MDPKDIKDGAKGVAKAEALLREMREANREFLAKTGKLGDRMDLAIKRAEASWRKTELGLKAAERETGQKIEEKLKDLFLGSWRVKS